MMEEAWTSLDALSIGALLGMFGVILGAFGSHGLEGSVSAEQIDTFETGVRYHMLHALVLVALGLAARNHPGGLTAVFTAGVLLFSGSIYALVLVDWSGLETLKTIVAISTPVGGSLLILGWGWLVGWSFTLS